MVRPPLAKPMLIGSPVPGSLVLELAMWAACRRRWYSEPLVPSGPVGRCQPLGQMELEAVA